MQFSVVVVAHYSQCFPTLAITSRYNRDVLFQELTSRPVSDQAECFIRYLFPPVETICKVAQKRSDFYFSSFPLSLTPAPHSHATCSTVPSIPAQLQGAVISPRDMRNPGNALFNLHIGSSSCLYGSPSRLATVMATPFNGQ